MKKNKTNSILIFPEGSHNYSPNMLINPLFDGPVNLALQTNRKIVVVTLIKDQENNVSYIDVSNPVDVKKLNVDMDKEFESEDSKNKYYVNSLSSIIRDKMATAVYYIIERHFETIISRDYGNLEEYLRMSKIIDAFKKLKWTRDVFEAEYLVKKTKADKEYEDVVRTISNLVINPNAITSRSWVLSELDIDSKDVPKRMREYWMSTKKEKRVIFSFFMLK